MRCHFPTYTNGNSNVYSEAEDIGIKAGDLDKWAFFYVAHGSEVKK